MKNSTIILLLAMLPLGSCYKNATQPYNFHWKGDLYLTDSLHLFADIPSPKPTDTYLWTFGDGTTSKEKDPVHYFDKLPTFNDTITLNLQRDGQTYVISKSVTFSGGGRRLVGARTWTGTRWEPHFMPGIFVYTALPDSVFVVSLVDENNVLFGNSKLSYLPGEGCFQDQSGKLVVNLDRTKLYFAYMKAGNMLQGLSDIYIANR